MTFRLAEPIVDELIAVLTADLPAKVITYAALAPALVLKPIVDISHGEKVHHPLPAIEVIPGTSPFFEASDGIAARHRILIGIFVEHADEQTLTRMLERYVACVLQTLADRRAGAGYTFTFQLATEGGGSIDWGSVRVADATLFQRDAFFEVICDTDERRV